MNLTKIEWCDVTWNPVTGCLHGCPYCYARKQAARFAGAELHSTYGEFSFKCWHREDDPFAAPYDHAKLFVVDKPLYVKRKNGKRAKAPYPFGFEPTYHRYRLGDPERTKKPQTIFVVSMGDLFGQWVPNKWIEEVFAACARAPWHRYLFLTKNPARYAGLRGPENAWYGTTAVNSADFVMPCRAFELFASGQRNKFLSVEPLLGRLDAVALSNLKLYQWIIVGAETGNRKGKVIPQREWIEDIVSVCRTAGIPVFMKGSLGPIWGAPLIQEFPWG